ncbi:uncharacterized protein LOC129174385 isoform X1 [Dunckerocampus dactyliophorus]|uniref:uncharacterized protein LOC129174385 isoform X1 n=1 Tax=Dunckerocampus dactyliophorus TaxID=161453 RepID=UPI002404A3B8|nr:uncharacterized protein LOC129174385 isoform X1 [Dunckerocampus dactyliophorus]
MTKDEHGPTLHHTSYSAGIPKVMYEGCGMMTLHLNASPTSTTECFMVEGLSNCNQLGPDTTGGSTYGSFVVGAASGRRHTRQQMRTFPTIQPLSYGVLEKTNVVRPLRHNHVHQQGELQPFGLSKMVPHGHGWRPFTLSYSERYKPHLSPAALFPSTLVLRGLSTLPAQNFKLSRPKVNYPDCNLLTLKDNLKSHSYPDPMVGAPRPFLHRISELSCLEGETARLEKMKKTRQPRKSSSS